MRKKNTYHSFSFIRVLIFLSLSVFLYANSLSAQEETEAEPSQKENKSKLNENIKKTLNLLSNEEYIYFIQWEEIPGNQGYSIQIKDKNDLIIMDTTVETSSIELSIPIGNYNMRISPLDENNEPFQWSAWNPFTVSSETAKSKYKVIRNTLKVLP